MIAFSQPSRRRAIGLVARVTLFGAVILGGSAFLSPPKRTSGEGPRLAPASAREIAAAASSAKETMRRAALFGGKRIPAPEALPLRGQSPADHECNHESSIDCPSSARAGELTTADCRLLSDGSFYDVWTFSGTQGQTVTIDMTSSDIDTYLALFNPSDGLVAENDDGSGTGTNARIVFTLTSTGTWTIIANSFGPDEIGGYTLTLTCAGGGPAPPTPPPVEPPSVCAANVTTMCLNGNRFRIRVSWRAVNQGTSGEGQAVPLTSDTGYFWFFSANNIELVIKALDGRGINGFFWVFYGALSDVEYTITVTDTQTGIGKVYFNPQNQLASVADTRAF